MDEPQTKPKYRQRRKLYTNVMERLVSLAYDEQIERYPAEAKARIDRADVEAWALNRLPPSYATSRRWVRALEVEVLKTHGERIQRTVQQALATILQNRQPSGEPHLPQGEAMLPPAFDWEKSLGR
jgi:hypothetical protein